MKVILVELTEENRSWVDARRAGDEPKRMTLMLEMDDDVSSSLINHHNDGLAISRWMGGRRVLES
jgi:hypothetical protein